jgi:hypothetical protein
LLNRTTYDPAEQTFKITIFLLYVFWQFLSDLSFFAVGTILQHPAKDNIWAFCGLAEGLLLEV